MQPRRLREEPGRGIASHGITWLFDIPEQIMIRLLSKIKKEIPRIRKEHWISFTYDLGTVTAPRNSADDLHIRRATENDIDLIATCPESREPIVESCIRFWKKYGFRQLYLGFLKNDPDPAIFQYVLDDTDNARYSSMEYGGMFRQHSPESVQIENIYRFKTKQRKNLAVDFELRLFDLLKQMGKRHVRGHINVHNKLALLSARMIPLRPDSWITMIYFDLPLLRSLKKKFFFASLREEDFEQFPLSLFKNVLPQNDPNP